MHKYCDGEQIAALCRLTDYDEDDIEAHREFMMKTWRAAAIFRIRIDDLLATDVPARDKVELLYGKEKDWVFVPTRSQEGADYDGYRFDRRHDDQYWRYRNRHNW